MEIPIKTLLAASAALMLPIAAIAQDRVDRIPPIMHVPPKAVAVAGMVAETLHVDVAGDGQTLWSGLLTVGDKYGSASFSQSINEYAKPCPGRAPGSEMPSQNYQLRFSISRHNWQTEADSFRVTTNWTQPLDACRGEGTNEVGVTRIIDIAPGGTVTIEGEGGLVVRVTRPR